MVKPITSRSFTKIPSRVIREGFPHRLSRLSRLADQVAVMFESRAPWDEDGKYTVDRLQVYYEDHVHHQLTIIPSDKTLLEALQSPG